MDKIKNWWRGHRPTTRRLIQLYAALLQNAHLRGFVDGEIYTGTAKAACVPGLNCYSCPAAAGACPLGALQNAIASSSNRPAFYVIGILLLLGLTLGRVICGWLCPMGLIQEWLHRLPTPKLKKSRWTRRLSWIKYGILIVFVVAMPLWYAVRRLPLPAFCKYICPAGTLEGAIGLLVHPANADKLGMLGLLFTRKFLILVLVLTACVFIYRGFCRFLCPLGAIYSLFARIALLGIRVDADACTGCGVCVRVCPMDIRRPGDHECIQCGACIRGCPEKAIRLCAGKHVLMGDKGPTEEKSRERSRRAGGWIWAAALIVLAAALVCFNLPAGDRPAETPAEDTEYTSDAPAGFEPGERPADFSLTQMNGDEFTLSQHRGQIVVINIWATWCGPCVKELPYFDRLQREHPDVAVLAIHSDLITDDVDAFLAGTDYQMAFAIDSTGEVIASLGGSTMLPQTVVLDRSGEVVYNRVGSVTYETLEGLLEEADA